MLGNAGLKGGGVLELGRGGDVRDDGEQVVDESGQAGGEGGIGGIPNGVHGVRHTPWRLIQDIGAAEWNFNGRPRAVSCRCIFGAAFSRSFAMRTLSRLSVALAL